MTYRGDADRVHELSREARHLGDETGFPLMSAGMRNYAGGAGTARPYGREVKRKDNIMEIRKVSTARRIAVAGLILGGLGIVILRLSGVDMPVVPPGLVLMLVAAIALATTRGRWAAVLASIVGVAEIGGFFASGSHSSLAELGSPWTMAGTWVRLIGIATATVAGLVASFASHRTRQQTIDGPATDV